MKKSKEDLLRERLDSVFQDMIHDVIKSSIALTMLGILRVRSIEGKPMEEIFGTLPITPDDVVLVIGNLFEGYLEETMGDYIPEVGDIIQEELGNFVNKTVVLPPKKEKKVTIN